jgi:hypothetical protein
MCSGTPDRDLIHVFPALPRAIGATTKQTIMGNVGSYRKADYGLSAFYCVVGDNARFMLCFNYNLGITGQEDSTRWQVAA